MKTNIATPFLLSILFALGGSLINVTPAAAQAFQPGEILVYGHTLAPPENFSYNPVCVARYSSGGTLLGTYYTYTTGVLYAALTPAGKLVVSYVFNPHFSGVGIYDPASGYGQIPEIFDPRFPTGGGGFSAAFGPISVFGNGTIALADHWRGGLSLWSQSGGLLNTVNVPNVGRITAGSDDILYVVSGNSQLARVNSSGSLLGYINLSFVPGDLAMNPLDGTLWITNGVDNSVEHVTTDGTVIGSFPTGLSGSYVGVDLDPTGNSLYLSASDSTSVEHFDLSGNLLDSFNLANPNMAGVLIVVPNPAPAPEPTSAVFLLSGIALLAARRRRC